MSWQGPQEHNGTGEAQEPAKGAPPVGLVRTWVQFGGMPLKAEGDPDHLPELPEFQETKPQL